MRLLQLALGDAPAAFAVAMEEREGRPALLGAGRGLNSAQAELSCRGEAMERLAASRRDALPVIAATRDDLPGQALSANLFWQYSRKQLRDGPHPSEELSAEAWLAAKRSVRHCSKWHRVVSARSEDAFFVPLDAVLLSGPTTSNGVAASESRSGARRAALLELVERDAVAIWWYGRIRRPAVALRCLDEAGGRDLRRWLEGRSRRTWMLDLTHDLEVPVVAAISESPDSSEIAYGFAAHSRVARAALSAVLEMLQSELSLLLAAQRAEKVGRMEGSAGRYLAWSRSATLARFPHLAPSETERPIRPAAEEADPVDLVAERTGQPVLFIDLDLPADPFRVSRALVPEFRPWRPRFRRGRLQSVPGSLGWHRRPVTAPTTDDVILI